MWYIEILKIVLIVKQKWNSRQIRERHMFADVRTNVWEEIVTVLSMKMSSVWMIFAAKLVFKPRRNYLNQSREAVDLHNSLYL